MHELTCHDSPPGRSFLLDFLPRPCHSPSGLSALRELQTWFRALWNLFVWTSTATWIYASDLVELDLEHGILI